MTTQLSYSDHIKDITMKAKAKVGVIFPKLRLSWLPLDMVIRIFLVYILPSLEYAIPIWMGSDPIKSAVERLNAVFNRYLKRYLGVHYTSCNHFTHFNCQTSPIFELLIRPAQERALDLYVPFCLSGAQLTFVNTIPKVKPYIPLYELVPSTFWRARAIHKVSLNPLYRRKIFIEMFDSKHYQNCNNKKFHRYPDYQKCFCTLCGESNHPFHPLYYCEDDKNVAT